MMSFADTSCAPARDEPTNDAGHPTTCECPVCRPDLYEQSAEQAKEVA